MVSRAFGILLYLAAAAPATASLSNLVSAWGHDFAVTPFEMKAMQVAVATDRVTGSRFNVIKLSNGHLMAVAPVDTMTMPPITQPKDLM